MKLYNIYNEVILEAVSNFKTWISGENNIKKNIIDMLDDDSGGKYYYCDMTYPDKKNNDIDRWVIIAQYGISKNNNDIIRVFEVTKHGGDNTGGKSKTYKISKIKKMRISKVPVYDLPKEFKVLYGSKAYNDSPNNPFKDGQALISAKFGSYQYAASTLKNKERAAAKAAKQQQDTNVEPQVQQQDTNVEPNVNLQGTEQPVVEPLVQVQQQEPEVIEPEVVEPTEPNADEEKINNLLNKNKINKRNG